MTQDYTPPGSFFKAQVRYSNTSDSPEKGGIGKSCHELSENVSFGFGTILAGE